MSSKNLKEKAIKILDILKDTSSIWGLKAKEIATNIYGRKKRRKQQSGRKILPEIRKLQKFGLIEKEGIKESSSRWKITRRGKEFLEKGA